MKIVVFGIGSFYKKIENVIKERYEIVAFTDNKVTELGETYQGIQLIPPAELKYQDYDKIVIASSYFKQISSQLLKMGIDNDKIAIIPAFQQFSEECRMVNLDEKGGCIYSINGISFYASEFCNFADAEEIIIKKGYNFYNGNDTATVIDIGMNIGLASLYFSKMKNVEKVYAFEPFKKTYEHAIHNIKLNSNIDGKKIEPFNIALSDKDGEMEIMYDEEHSSGMSLIYGINSNESKDKEMIKYRKASDIFGKIISEIRIIQLYVRLIVKDLSIV